MIQTELTGKANTTDEVVVKAEPGSTVKLLDKDGQELGHATAGDDGVARITPTRGVPTDNTERKPEVVTPDEQPAETENTTTKPKASQNILPNTGTADGLGIFSAAAASILSGLGLVVFGKKEDEESENN